MNDKPPTTRSLQSGALPSLVVRLDPSAVNVMVRAAGGERSALMKAGEEGVIGTGTDARLVVDDPTVSRAHVRLRVRPGEVQIEDLKSTNGTFYEGARIESAVLPAGVAFKIGHATVRLLPAQSEVLAPGTARTFGGMIADDPRMNALFLVLRDVAQAEASVFIEGEAGTGKALLAASLHAGSKRSAGPFVVFDCAGVPRDHVEAALFGQAGGGPDSAVSLRIGAVKRAHGGTLLLREVGALPLEVQQRLLRVLESKAVEPVGASQPENVDVRIVAASKRDIQAEVRQGRFREDLLIRLGVVKVKLPPLRERTSDIPLLARHFAKQAKAASAIDEESLEKLKKHLFIGNVKELEDLVGRALAGSKRFPIDLVRFIAPPEPAATTPAAAALMFTGSGDIVERAVKEAMDEKVSFKDAKSIVVDSFERAFFRNLIAACGGNLTRAAGKAQMDRKHLRDLLRRHGLREDEKAD